MSEARQRIRGRGGSGSDQEGAQKGLLGCWTAPFLGGHGNYKCLPSVGLHPAKHPSFVLLSRRLGHSSETLTQDRHSGGGSTLTEAAVGRSETKSHLPTMTSQVHDILSTYNHKKKKNKETFWLIYHKGKNINPGMSKVYHHARTRGAREDLQIHFFSLARILSGDCITA